MWIGSLVHDEISRILNIFKKTGRVLSPEKAREHMFDRMKSEWQESIRRVQTRIAKMFGLKEHEYGQKMDKAMRLKLRDKAFKCLNNFYEIILDEILDNSVENWLYIDNGQFTKFLFELDDGTSINCFSIPDFAMRKSDKVIIYDWKTGSPGDQYKTQAVMYSLYAKEFWSAAEVETVLVYLASGSIKRCSVNDEDIRDVREQINNGVLEMTELLENKDRKANKAIKIAGTNSTDLDKFPLTDNTSHCFFCNFGRICGIQNRH